MKPETKERSKSLPRTGVILCHCGSEILNALDFRSLEKGVGKLPGVIFTASQAYPCSRPGLAMLEAAIKEHRLERIVVAGCTPRLHGKLFSEACERAGLNRWFIDVANIREHCSRVHKDKDEATEKALSLVAASVTKVGFAEAREPIRVKPLDSVLVIGGGVSGLSVAAELLGLGHAVTLIEKTNALGGMLLRLGRLYPYARPPSEMIREKLSGLEGKAEILTQTRIASLAGGPGQYRVSLAFNGKREERDFGAVVVATGMECFGADGLTDASTYAGQLLTQMELEEKQEMQTLKKARSIIFAEAHPRRLGHSASRLHSLLGLSNATLLKEADSALELTFVFRNMPAEMEREFRRARDAGVKFIRCADDTAVEFTKEGLRLRRGREKAVEIKAEVIVLPALCVPAEGTGELSETLRIPTDADGFYVEPHVKLRPGDFIERGLFVVGSCHSPATVFECASQAAVTASRVSRFLSGEVERSPFVSRIDERICRGCGRCAEECRWNAIEMETLENTLKLAKVNDTLCTGCGVCSTVCICGAPALAPMNQNQIRKMVNTLGG